MNGALLLVGSIFVGLAAIIHIAIFALESVLWSKPSTWRRFGVRSQEDADVLRPMAYNQGFYNVFLALGAIASLVMVWSADVMQGGIVLAIFTLSSMLLASIVLVASNPKLVRAAIFQGAAPLLGLAFLVLVAYCLIWPIVSPYDPYEVDFSQASDKLGRFGERPHHQSGIGSVITKLVELS